MQEVEQLSEEPDNNGENGARRGWQKAMLPAALLLLVAVPVTLALVLSASLTTAVLLVYLPVVSLLLGVADALVFRFTWSFPILCGLAFLVSTWVFYNGGAWVYAVGVVLLGMAGEALAVLGPRKAGVR